MIRCFEKSETFGIDVWTWVAIDADTKLVPSWRIGDRTSETGLAFVDDLAKRLANRVQITSDGDRAYRSYLDPEAHERVAVRVSHALGRADRIAFNEAIDNLGPAPMHGLRR